MTTQAAVPVALPFFFEVDMFGFFRDRKLEDVLNPTRVVRVHGVRFVIRKLNPIDYLGGSKAVRQIYESFKSEGLHSIEMRQVQQKDIEDHYIDTFLAAVVEPKLKLAPVGPGDADGVPAANLLTDWAFSNQLYQLIIEFSYGKKKVASISSRIAASKST